MAADPNPIWPESLFTIKATSVYRKQVCEERRREKKRGRREEGRGAEEKGGERRGKERGEKRSWRQLQTQFYLTVCLLSELL